jgi:hypothetical protein
MNASSVFCKPWPRRPCGNGGTLNSPCTQTSAACWTSKLCLQVAGDYVRLLPVLRVSESQASLLYQYTPRHKPRRGRVAQPSTWRVCVK